jgi:hypothetical protein
VIRRKEEAARAWQGSKGAATTTRQLRAYPIPRLSSSPQPQKTSPTSLSLGLLVLLLSARASELPAHQVRRVWALAERWLGEIVAARHQQVLEALEIQGR